jgi:NAD-dependent dihydropyrimidine dehydrogenase PreA subunit
MSKRKIIQIDEKLCTGCGHCVSSCSQGAIAIVKGKAKLVSEHYCDGLGACIGHCPTGALTIVEKETAAYQQPTYSMNACPSQQVSQIKNGCLSNWPIQIALVAPSAPFLEQANLLIAADCTAFAMASYHDQVLKNKIVLIGCPKLDNAEFYIKKLTEIFNVHTFKSITVARMEVPCCKKLTAIVQTALDNSTQEIQMQEIILNRQGELLD